ncbi:MAG: hypothetical protein A2Z30_02050 [Chloroflexi bacterium RBG_16_64_43]|nr:MAG: hypothetical protein A2Z30_02050 [Chloroflexi bacterium RBG_16_64_43]
MPTCAVCSSLIADGAARCPTCGADLGRRTALASALTRLQANPRVTMVRVSVADDCCPTCAAVQGAYPKEKAPFLPQGACSAANGCRCYYEPVLNDIYP